MKEQKIIHAKKEIQNTRVENQEGLETKTLVKKFALERNYMLNKGLAIYLIYGDLPEHEWEQPLPEWVNELPDGAALTKS